jgi:MFS family permease
LTPSSASEGRVAFRYPNFRYFVTARFLSSASSEMQAVAVGWQIYGLTHRPLDLGLVGLAQFLPGILLFPITGHAADRYPRRAISAACSGCFALCSALLLYFTLTGLTKVYPIYAVLLLNGVVRAFSGPANQALLPMMVPAIHFPNAVAWGSSIFQGAMVLGPIVGGTIYTLGGQPAPVYASAIAAYLTALVLMLLLRVDQQQMPRGAATFGVVWEGLRFIWRNPIILGSISLDLFAVLLGGAVALLPVYAREILHVGALGLGALRAAPGAGAVAMAIVVAHNPLRRRAGAAMLWGVLSFGVFTIVFGLSHNLWVALIALFLLGASDMVSVVVRQTLVQIGTPDEMRGRVGAVNMVFISASNEVGQFESGVTAQLFGTVPAVIAGGIGTILVVMVWTRVFPALRRCAIPE